MGSPSDDAYWNEKYDDGPVCDEHMIFMDWSDQVEDYECPECVADWDAYLHG